VASAGLPPGTNSAITTSAKRKVAASTTSTAGAPISAIRTPASGGPISIVIRVAPWSQAFAALTWASSSPRISARTTRCDAK
jgi:hypothetical protein